MDSDRGWGAAERLTEWLRTSGTAATSASLVARFGDSALQSATADGRVARVLPAIYVCGDLRDDPVTRCRALVAWSAPHGFVTGLAAAHLWGIVDAPPQRITLQVPPSWHLQVPEWAGLLRVQAAPMAVARVQGILAAGPADALVQSWREARPDVGAAAVIAAVMREVTAPGDLLDALARRKKVPRKAELAELLRVVRNAVTSYLEWVAWRDVFPPSRYPHLRWQVPKWANGRKRVFDAWDAEAGIDLEFDGGSTHGGVDGFERDRQRDADVRAEGWEPLHFTYRDLTQRPEWCRAVYEALRSSRLAQPQMVDAHRDFRKSPR